MKARLEKRAFARSLLMVFVLLLAGAAFFVSASVAQQRTGQLPPAPPAPEQAAAQPAPPPDSPAPPQSDQPGQDITKPLGETSPQQQPAEPAPATQEQAAKAQNDTPAQAQAEAQQQAQSQPKAEAQAQAQSPPATQEQVSKAQEDKPAQAQAQPQPPGPEQVPAPSTPAQLSATAEPQSSGSAAPPSQSEIFPLRERTRSSLMSANFIFYPIKAFDPFAPFIAPETSNVNEEEPKTAPLTPLQRMSLGELEKGLKAITWGQLGEKAVIEDSTGRGYIVVVGTPAGDHSGVIKEISKDHLVIQQEIWDRKAKKRFPQEYTIKLSKKTDNQKK